MAVNPARCTGTVFNDANYAEAVHDGTRAHPVVAKSKKALKFTYRGETVYAKSVWIPARAGRPWLTAAAQQVAATSGANWSSTKG